MIVGHFCGPHCTYKLTAYEDIVSWREMWYSDLYNTTNIIRILIKTFSFIRSIIGLFFSVLPLFPSHTVKHSKMILVGRLKYIINYTHGQHCVVTIKNPSPISFYLLSISNLAPNCLKQKRDSSRGDDFCSKNVPGTVYEANDVKRDVCNVFFRDES